VENSFLNLILEVALAKAHAALNFVDLAPSISNLSFGQLIAKNELVACTVLPQSDMWISLNADDPLSKGREIHRSLIGEEAMLLNGFPTMDPRLEAVFASASSTQKANFGGNSFPSTVIASFIIAIYFALDQSQVSDKAATNTDDVADAMHLLKKARRAAEPS